VNLWKKVRNELYAKRPSPSGVKIWSTPPTPRCRGILLEEIQKVASRGQGGGIEKKEEILTSSIRSVYGGLVAGAWGVY
jgi:hypothetical protein